jgi:alpha-1,3-glucosyltransferase
VESVYLLGIVPLEAYCMFVHSYFGLADKLPFLPLMLTSVYCAVGVVYCWLKFYLLTLDDRGRKIKQS